MTVEEEAINARQGKSSGKVRLVVSASMILAIIAAISVFAIF